MQSEAIRVGDLKSPKSFRVTNPYTRFAAEFVQTNRWHKQQLVTRSVDAVYTAWDAISLCHQLKSPKSFWVANPYTLSAADYKSAASQDTHSALECAALFKVTLHHKGTVYKGNFKKERHIRNYSVEPWLMQGIMRGCLSIASSAASCIKQTGLQRQVCNGWIMLLATYEQKLQTTNLLCVVSFTPFANKRRENISLKREYCWKWYREDDR